MEEEEKDIEELILQFDMARMFFAEEEEEEEEEEARIVVSLTDITDRKRAEEELKRRLDELEIYYNATVGREGRIIELKQEVNKLMEGLGKERKYGG
ncbi:MAG: hypothetical protein Q7J67_07780 [bacterium]|nr:hypothetical protein [bacterium]